MDNASKDDTVELVRRKTCVKLIANPTNRGFAGAVNQGVAALDTEMILLLNPDVELQTTIDPLTDACGHASVGMADRKLLDLPAKCRPGLRYGAFLRPDTGVEVLGINRLLPSTSSTAAIVVWTWTFPSPPKWSSPPARS